MGQGDIVKFLKAHRGVKYTTLELSKHLHINKSSTTSSLNRLLKINIYNIKRIWLPNSNLARKKMVVYMRKT